MSRKARVSDKDRLDWLSRKETAFYRCAGPSGFGIDFEKAGFFGGSLRQAIDAAIKAERRAGRRK